MTTAATTEQRRAALINSIITQARAMIAESLADSEETVDPDQQELPLA